MEEVLSHHSPRCKVHQLDNVNIHHRRTLCKRLLCNGRIGQSSLPTRPFSSGWSSSFTKVFTNDLSFTSKLDLPLQERARDGLDKTFEIPVSLELCKLLFQFILFTLLKISQFHTILHTIQIHYKTFHFQFKELRILLFPRKKQTKVFYSLLSQALPLERSPLTFLIFSNRLHRTYCI